MTNQKTKIISPKKLENIVDILKAIGHHDRLQIVNILLAGEYRVEQLVEILGLGQSNTSQQLIKLKMHRVVKSRRDGNKTYYSLANESIKNVVVTIVNEV